MSLGKRLIQRNLLLSHTSMLDYDLFMNRFKGTVMKMQLKVKYSISTNKIIISALLHRFCTLFC